MMNRTTFSKILFTLFFLFAASSMRIAICASNNFKIIIFIFPAENFKHKYPPPHTYYEYETKFNVNDIQQALTNKLNNSLSSHKANGAWEAIFCKTAKEFEEKTAKNDVFLGLRIEITEYRSSFKDSYLDNNEESELTINCDLRKKTGVAWEKIFVKRVTSQSTGVDNKKIFKSSIETMSKQIDTTLINSMLSYQVLSAMSKDVRTKLIKIKVLNTSPLSIKRLTWFVPGSKEDVAATTEGIIKPGQAVEVTLNIQSDTSHAAIGWRSTYITEIEFDQSAK